MDIKTQYCEDVSYYQLDLQSRCNLNQNPSNLLWGEQQSESYIYKEREKAQSSEDNIGEQSRTDKT